MIVSDPALRSYFELHAGKVPEKTQFLGRWDKDRVLGVVAVWNFNGQNAEVGWCGEPGWLSRGFLRVVFAYLWQQLHLGRVTGRIYKDNAQAIEASKRLGFKYEGFMRKAGPEGQDVMIFGLLKEECPHGWQQ